jgi:hypothetical protein
MSGDPIRWRALRLGVYCAAVGVAALVLESHTLLHGSHTVVGLSISDSQRQLLGTVAIALFGLAVTMALGSVIDGDWLARIASTPAVLLAVATLVGGVLVFAAYRVQQDSLHPKQAGTPPVLQVDCPVRGGTCFAASGGGTYPAAPVGYDPADGCTWSDAGHNPARTEEIYDCNN